MRSASSSRPSGSTCSALAAEEGSRFDAVVSGDDVSVQGNERLLRRALRNLLENARRYGGERRRGQRAGQRRRGARAR